MDAQAYNQLVSNQADPLYRFVLKNTGQEAKAQDIVQESFERMWTNREKVMEEKARTYLFTTAYHLIIDGVRRDKRIVLTEDIKEDAFYYSTEYTGTADLLEQGVSMLPDAQKSVVLLRDYEGYSYKEISDMTGLNEPQVKVYIHRARQFLRKFITNMETYRSGA